MIWFGRDRVGSIHHHTSPQGTPHSGPTSRPTRTVSIRRLLCAALVGSVVLASLACGGDTPPPRDRGHDAGGSRVPDPAGAAGRALGAGGRPAASNHSSSFGADYIPEVLGVKTFAVDSKSDLEPYFSASGGRSVTPDAMFDDAEAMFGRLPDGEPVFSRDTPTVVTVVMFDCRPSGDIRLEGTTRLIDETVPGDPFVMYERPFSIMRRQEGNGFTISTSSGRGCMDNLNAGAPSGGWAPGPYSVEYRRSSGELLVSIPFEVAGVSSPGRTTSKQTGDDLPSSDGRSSETRGYSDLKLWIDVQLGRLSPSAQIELSSDLDIEPGALLVRLELDRGNLPWGLNMHNINPISGGAGFVAMDFDPIELLPQARWYDRRLTGVSASLLGHELSCLHDVAASDRRRQHSFDNRQVFFCTPSVDSPGGSSQGSGSSTDEQYYRLTPGGEIIVVPPGGQIGGTPQPTTSPLDLLNIQK